MIVNIEQRYLLLGILSLTVLFSLLSTSTAYANSCIITPAVEIASCKDDICQQGFQLSSVGTIGLCGSRMEVVDIPEQSLNFSVLAHKVSTYTLNGVYKLTTQPECLLAWQTPCNRNTRLERLSTDTSSSALEAVKGQMESMAREQYIDYLRRMALIVLLIYGPAIFSILAPWAFYLFSSNVRRHYGLVLLLSTGLNIVAIFLTLFTAMSISFDSGILYYRGERYALGLLAIALLCQLLLLLLLSVRKIIPSLKK